MIIWYPKKSDNPQSDPVCQIFGRLQIYILIENNKDKIEQKTIVFKRKAKQIYYSK